MKDTIIKVGVGVMVGLSVPTDPRMLCRETSARWEVARSARPRHTMG